MKRSKSKQIFIEKKIKSNSKTVDWREKKMSIVPETENKISFPINLKEHKDNVKQKPIAFAV